MRIGFYVPIDPNRLKQGNRAIMDYKRRERKRHGFWYNLFHFLY